MQIKSKPRATVLKKGVTAPKYARNSTAAAGQARHVPRQQRAVQTRAALLQSARKIIARDGFEHARIEDIASAAGKTRGAFYNNFQDKEEVFFAIVEEYIRRDFVTLIPALQQAISEEERLQHFASHLLTLSRDRERTLLAIEFKLYAIRHPRRRKRLADLHAALCIRNKGEYADLIPNWKPHSEQATRMAIAAVGTIIDGAALNRWFDPAQSENPCLDQLLRQTLVKFLSTDFSSPLPALSDER